HCIVVVFLFHDPAPTQMYTLSLHDALPILAILHPGREVGAREVASMLPDSGVVKEIPRGAPVEVSGGSLTERLDAYERALILARSEEHTSELQSRENLVCRLLLEKKNIVIR